MESWIFLSFLAGILAIYHYFRKDLYYFKKHGIIYMPPLPFMGNMTSIFFRKISSAAFINKIYNLNRHAKYVGFFDVTNPVLMIRDLDLIKSITVKNFDMFPDHRAFIEEINDPLFAKNLFFLSGDKWRDLRALSIPAFTSRKINTMFMLISNCAVKFADFLSKIPPDKNIIEMKDNFTRYTNDVIATCVFGINVDSVKNPTNEFYLHGIEATTFNLTRTIKFYLAKSMPFFSKMLGIKIINDRVSRFFKDIIRSTINTRDMYNIVRPDMLQLLMETRGKRGPGKELAIEDITSLAFSFFYGGFETTSNLICFAAHEIAVDSNIQTRLCEEIDEVLKRTSGVLTYEALNDMPYLDAVINETFRMYPVATFLDRMCVKDFELPPALPGDKPFIVKKGMTVCVPVYGLHHDPKYFEEPEMFCPERFLDENRKNINTAAYIPFGLGPRMCIGNRFALLKTKVMLFHLLARCELKPCAKTTYPIQLSKTVFSMKANSGFWLKIQPRNDVHANASVNLVNSNVTNNHL